VNKLNRSEHYFT